MASRKGFHTSIFAIQSFFMNWYHHCGSVVSAAVVSNGSCMQETRQSRHGRGFLSLPHSLALIDIICRHCCPMNHVQQIGLHAAETPMISTRGMMRRSSCSSFTKISKVSCPFRSALQTSWLRRRMIEFAHLRLTSLSLHWLKSFDSNGLFNRRYENQVVPIHLHLSLVRSWL